MSGKYLSLLLIPLFFIGFFQISAQEYNPLVFRDVLIQVSLDENGNALVTIQGEIVNTAKVPVVPGYGYVNLTVSPESVLDVKAWIDGKEVEAIKLKDKIRYTVWRPIPSNKSVKVKIHFEVRGAVTKGLLFHEFKMPVSKFSTRVQGMRVVISVPPGYHVTYVKPEPKSLSSTVIWDLHSGFLELEYSQVPLPTLPVKGYLVFWPSLAFLLILIGLVIRKVKS